MIGAYLFYQLAHVPHKFSQNGLLLEDNSFHRRFPSFVEISAALFHCHFGFD
jgi:hypothetical protein